MVLVLRALVYMQHRVIEPRITGARLSTLAQAALVYKVLVYKEWIRCGSHLPLRPKSQLSVAATTDVVIFSSAWMVGDQTVDRM